MYILEKDNNFTWLNLENKIKDSSLSNNEIVSLKKISDLEIKYENMNKSNKEIISNCENKINSINKDNNNNKQRINDIEIKYNNVNIDKDKLKKIMN